MSAFSYIKEFLKGIFGMYSAGEFWEIKSL